MPSPRAVLAGSLVGHPYLSGRLPNDTEVAEAVVDSTTRWGLVHLATGVASGLVILAFLAIRSYLRDAGDDRFSAVGVPFVVIGSTLFALLPGMEFAPLAAAESGTDIVAAQAALQAQAVGGAPENGPRSADCCGARTNSVTPPTSSSWAAGDACSVVPGAAMSVWDLPDPHGRNPRQYGAYATGPRPKTVTTEIASCVAEAPPLNGQS